MQWGQDAFWQWNIRGDVLRAYSRESAEALREFISRERREPSDFGPEFAPFLASVPSQFLQAKVRKKIVKMIGESLAATAKP